MLSPNSELRLRQTEWLRANSHRNSIQRRHGAMLEAEKPRLPAEHLRKIVKQHGDMSARKYRADRRVYLGALKYMPHAIYASAKAERRVLCAKYTALNCSTDTRFREHIIKIGLSLFFRNRYSLKYSLIKV